MNYKIKGQILGFEDTTNVSINAVDTLFLTMKDTDNENIFFTLANPNVLREYSFDLPRDVKVLLGINEDSSIDVYNIVVIQKPLENSTINFLAPIVVNNDNNTVAQAVLNPKQHPDFGMAESIKSFKQEN
jgi:flagellar assembly factor FliW